MLMTTPTTPAAPKRSAALDRPERVLSTLNKDGSRRWLRPKLSHGRFLLARRVVASVLIAVFTLLPYLRIQGKPAVLLDLSTRHFTLFGSTFLPTDTVLLALLMLGLFVTIFLLTALLGRVWCGWACPQTVYMEFVFRPIERFFDGANARSGRTSHKGFRGSGAATILKYVAFLLVSIYLAHTFLAYFVGVEQLAVWVRRSPFEHPAGFLIVSAVTALMMFDFCFFREQTCIVACPYGRFQSVMLDRQSMIISYDLKRGEPRGKKTRPTLDDTTAIPLPIAQSVAPNPATAANGDCIDCHMCVTTCPTGIDIREGLQMECIGCAQCIDACDEVMDRIHRPRGLIRYSSQSAMAGETKRLLRPRVVAYPLILVVIVSLFSLALVRRGDAYVTVLRGLGRTFTEMPSGEIGNPVRVKIVNRTDHPATYAIAVSGVDGAHLQIDNAQSTTINAGESATIPAMIVAPFEDFERGRCVVNIVISDGARFTQSIAWPLMGPGSRAATSPHRDNIDAEDDHREDPNHDR